MLGEAVRNEASGSTAPAVAVAWKGLGEVCRSSTPSAELDGNPWALAVRSPHIYQVTEASPFESVVIIVSVVVKSKIVPPPPVILNLTS